MRIEGSLQKDKLYTVEEVKALIETEVFYERIELNRKYNNVYNNMIIAGFSVDVITTAFKGDKHNSDRKKIRKDKAEYQAKK
ncbi:hypothetical protein I6N96_07690 [Enterococcus sp. BWM-S5]|uniref:Phage protein n=1 Tax=Enterococcus larvae TaxID=2794352 RepID=A0ABS4CJR0_9ENTE|nr:hypothetical protein [Enterococcus larvae]MBP1046162.1 hypothetical protein [Enterococcus larvae]